MYALKRNAFGKWSMDGRFGEIVQLEVRPRSGAVRRHIWRLTWESRPLRSTPTSSLQYWTSLTSASHLPFSPSDKVKS